MDDKFLCGVVCGMLGGALVATHSAKAREAVKTGEEEVKNKVKELTDGKANKKSAKK